MLSFILIMLIAMFEYKRAATDKQRLQLSCIRMGENDGCSD